MKPLRLRLRRIEKELINVQRHFSSINAALKMRREDLPMTCGGTQDDVDLFSDKWLEALLQLNHLVLHRRGYDPTAFGGHLSATRQRFFVNFRQYVEPIRHLAPKARDCELF